LPSASDLPLTLIYPWAALAGLVLGVVLLVLYLQARRRLSHALQSQAGVARQLQQTRTHDSLTVLYNRTGFEQELRRTLERCAADNDQACVLYLDVDQFQTIDNAFGTAVGDAVLSDIVRREDARLLQDLRGALKRRELFLYYQPKVEATSLQITAAEVLMRWRHPTLGVLGPD